VSKQPRTAIFTSDFSRGFQAETESLLRRRFLWYAGLMAAVTWLSLPGVVLVVVPQLAGTKMAAMLTESILYAGLYPVGFVYTWLGRPRDTELLRLTTAVVVIDGLINVAERATVHSLPNLPDMMGLPSFMISHILACLFLPWSPMQAMRPVVLVVAVSAISRLFAEGATLFDGFGAVAGDAVWIALSPLVGLPGTFICWWRHSRRLEGYKLRFLQQRYGEVRRELVDARRIHESLFPKPIEDGSFRFMYAYEPMRQIGGDFLFVRAGEGGLSAVLIDVTGHGIPAALTVNRLHGELERLFAEDRGIGAGEVLRLLNRYVHLTLATHSVYVTAFCARVTADGLEYASGGHPPAFVKTVDGRVEQLDSTAFVLGACADRDFDPGACRVEFGPGDAVIVYTDGATEARDRTGAMLGIAGLQRVIAGSRPERPGDWPELILGRVEAHRFGPPADDTLVIEVHRPLS